MAKSSPRRVTFYINGKKVGAVKQICFEMSKLVNEQNRMVIGRVSPVAAALTGEKEVPLAHCIRLRNGVRHRIRQGGKMGGEGGRAVARHLLSAAHLFSLPPRMRRTIPRGAKRRSGTSSEETWPATVRRGLKIKHKTAFPRVR